MYLKGWVNLKTMYNGVQLSCLKMCNIMKFHAKDGTTKIILGEAAPPLKDRHDLYSLIGGS